MSQDDKIWFIHIDNSPDGPYSNEEIWNKLESGEIGYNNYIWKKGYKNWKKIETESTFDQAPPEPPPPLNSDIPPTLQINDPDKEIEIKAWYINETKVRSGPFKQSEIIDKIKKNIVTESTFIWKKGMKQWVLAHKSTEFKEYFGKKKITKKQKAEDFIKNIPATPREEESLKLPFVDESQDEHNSPEKNIENKRKNPRAPLLARIIAHDNQDIAYMPCGNISTGGVFVFTEKFLWEPGTSLKLNIKSDELSEAFNVEGEVIRYSERPNKGYNIKFSNISDKYIAMLKNYIKTKT